MKCGDCEGAGFKEYDAGLLVMGCIACSGIGKVDEALTEEEFLKAYAFRSDMTPDQVTELGLIAVPDDCIEGWAMVQEAVESGLHVNLCDTCQMVNPGCYSPDKETITDSKGIVFVAKCGAYYAPEDTEVHPQANVGIKTLILPEPIPGKTMEETEAIARELKEALAKKEAEEKAEEVKKTRELGPNEYRCSKCSKPGKTIIHMLQKSGKGIGHKHQEFKA